MKKIDRETVSRILDAADIVDVVSDFVTLKKRGANYMGLCPFHSERSPSFSVSKSKGICKCFSCGKGGGTVNFLMELEGMSFQEALRWLAKKYNIPVKEREETEAERENATLRESLFAVNAFALEHFEHNLFDTPEGRQIGLSYFEERGLTHETIRKFRLGYALDKPRALTDAAERNGFTVENLVKTGLCGYTENGKLYERFHGRVIFPVLSLGGKVVAFGGRILVADKKKGKYVNSPESEIYLKRRELYGLYQAKQSITRNEKCYLVEGYMDVLSMSQSGIENVVASSGTSLTSEQVNLMHRFSENVTVIYDADAAGIKASLRGIDLLLADGMNVKVVLFPEGEDPDSYARSHSRQELSDYLSEHETDFIKFKTDVLLNDAKDDPIERSKAINNILDSIAVIPNPITRQVYIDECARTFGMGPKILAAEVSKRIAQNREKQFKEAQQRKAEEIAAEAVKADERDRPADSVPSDTPAAVEHPQTLVRHTESVLYRTEKELLRYLVRYGMLVIGPAYAEDGSVTPFTYLDYAVYELNNWDIGISDPALARLLDTLIESASLWDERLAAMRPVWEAEAEKLRETGRERIRRTADSATRIMQAEEQLEAEISEAVANMERGERREYFRRLLRDCPDDELRRLALDMISDKYELSKVHSKFARIETEEDRLTDLMQRVLFELRDALLEQEIETLNKRIAETSAANSEIVALMTSLMEKMKTRREFAHFLGERIITPPRKS